jgi:hypothetical protein
MTFFFAEDENKKKKCFSSCVYSPNSAFGNEFILFCKLGSPLSWRNSCNRCGFRCKLKFPFDSNWPFSWVVAIDGAADDDDMVFDDCVKWLLMLSTLLLDVFALVTLLLLLLYVTVDELVRLLRWVRLCGGGL